MSSGQSTSKRSIGYVQPAQYFCRECASGDVREFADRVVEGDDYGIPYLCDRCGATLVPCEHEWGEWRAWWSGGEFRSCEQPHCDEIEQR